MIAVAANIEKDHFVVCSLALILEHNGFGISTTRTTQILRATQGRISHELINNSRLFFRYELQVIPKYQRIGRLSTIWAIATGIHEHMVRLVSFWVQ